MLRVMMLALAGLCSACASLPSKEQLAAFSEASGKGVSTVSQVVDSGHTLEARQDELRQASNFVRGKRFAAESIPKSQRPPKAAKAQIVIDEQLQIRLNALKDLQAYSKAVGDAADQGTVDGLVSATEKLGTNIGELAKIIVPEAGAVASPAIKLIGKSAGYGLADSYVHNVNGVIKEADPVVAEVIRLLRLDLAGLPPRIDFDAGKYAALREVQLRLIRDDRRVNRSELHNAFFSARADIAANYELAKAADAVDGVLKAIADTHHSLVEGKPDVDLTIKKMSALSTDLAAVITAMKKG